MHFKDIGHVLLSLMFYWFHIIITSSICCLIEYMYISISYSHIVYIAGGFLYDIISPQQTVTRDISYGI